MTERHIAKRHIYTSTIFALEYAWNIIGSLRATTAPRSVDIFRPSSEIGMSFSWRIYILTADYWREARLARRTPLLPRLADMSTARWKGNDLAAIERNHDVHLAGRSEVIDLDSDEPVLCTSLLLGIERVSTTVFRAKTPISAFFVTSSSSRSQGSPSHTNRSFQKAYSVTDLITHENIEHETICIYIYIIHYVEHTNIICWSTITLNTTHEHTVVHQ